MWRLFLIFGLLLAVPIQGHAQGTPPGLATAPGYWSYSGCQSGISPCWFSYGAAVPVAPGSVTIVPLDASTVVTGGTAVTALAAGNAAKGGFLQNPIGAAQALCINQVGTASGTTSAGDTTCIQPGQSYNLIPSPNAVSVISSDSSHAFSGNGAK